MTVVTVVHPNLRVPPAGNSSGPTLSAPAPGPTAPPVPYDDQASGTPRNAPGPIFRAVVGGE